MYTEKYMSEKEKEDNETSKPFCVRAYKVQVYQLSVFAHTKEKNRWTTFHCALHNDNKDF